MNNRLFVKVTRKNLPQVKDRYPFLFLEHGKLVIDGHSIKWIDSEKNIVRIPCATINTILLGPGTSVTHEAIKILAASNCTVCWVGADNLLFYAIGQSPTSNTRNLHKQIQLSVDPIKSVKIAQRMFAYRFPKLNLKDKTINEMMGMEGYRVRELYDEMAKKYNVGWKGRCYVPGNFKLGDITNQLLTSSNAALYAILCSAIYSMGYSPHIGFIHSGSPLPFVYDMADLYKEYLCIDLAFSQTLEMAGKYDKFKMATAFRKRVIEMDLLKRISKDIKTMLYG